MLLPTGGVIDDLIAYFVTESWFRLVVNAGTRRKDLAWIEEHAAPYGVSVRERSDLSILAVQGPDARAQDGLAPFAGASRHCARHRTLLRGRDRCLVSRPHRIHRRGWIRDHAAEPGRRCDMAGAHRAGRVAGGTRRPRYAAPGGRHVPVRQRPGREPPSLWSRAWSGPSRSSRRSAISSAEARSRRRAPPRATRSSAWCSRSAASCAAIRR